VEVTAQLAKLVTESRLDNLLEPAIAIVKDRILDTVGVSLAGTVQDSGRIATAYVRERGGTPEAGVIGGGFRVPTETAALANGVLAHAQLYEDDGTDLIGHPSSPLVAVILPVAEWCGASGLDVIRAYILGFEVEVKLGRAVNPAMYDHGWHNTGIIGAVGATAAVAHLLRLPAGELHMAFGIVASLGAGIRQNFGTMTMALHVGNAARNGVVAALLARRGFNADPLALEGPLGFANLFAGSDQHDLRKLLDHWTDPLEVTNPGSTLKFYPAGGPTNTGIDGILDIVAHETVRPEDVAEIVWAGPERWVNRTVFRTNPRRAIEGKTSLLFCLAVALVDREVTLHQFTEEKIRDPRIRGVMDKVRVVSHPELAEDVFLFGSEVTIRMKDGREFRRLVRMRKGHPDNPLSPQELLRKYTHCADLALTPEARDRSVELLQRLDALDAAGVRELAQVICRLP
jgi:2-methylcitrate dehydratase PrpD